MIGIDTTFLVHLEIREAPEHLRAHQILQHDVIDAGEQLALVPQVLAEFIHVVTDAKRFQQPLSMPEALEKSLFWWNAREVTRVYPTAASVILSFDWMQKNSLGRKRILDTQLAATLWTAGVHRILPSNARDFSIFGVFEAIVP